MPMCDWSSDMCSSDLDLREGRAKGKLRNGLRTEQIVSAMSLKESDSKMARTRISNTCPLSHPSFSQSSVHRGQGQRSSNSPWPSEACVRAQSLQSCPTLQRHGPWPARLLCPWDSPGKSTGEVLPFPLQVRHSKWNSQDSRPEAANSSDHNL